MIQCEALRPNGERCRATALPNRPQCFAHDPDNRERATAARRKGGENRSTPARAAKKMGTSHAQILRLIEAGLAGVYKGQITPQQGGALASLAGAWVRLHEHGELTLEVAELRERIDATGTHGRSWS